MNSISSATVSEIRFDPTSPEIIADPYPHYDRLRSQDPVYPLDSYTWFLTRYEDVALVLRDRRFGRDFAKARAPETLNELVHVNMSKMLIYLEPPDHTRVRSVLTRAAPIREFESLRVRIQQTVDELIAQVEPRGYMDLVSDFALPLPLTVICELLGVPSADRSMFFEEGLRSNGRALDIGAITRADLDRANARSERLGTYFRALFEKRRRDPSDDLISYLVQAHASDALSAQELLSTVLFFFVAGHETTANLIGNALVALFRHPRELELVRREPAVLSRAVDELIRYDTSVQFSGRSAREDVEMGGKLIRKGDVVIASYGAANRDPAVFEDPHRFDLKRQNVRPLSFGIGIHFCIGAQIARMELEIALSTLFRKFPTLKPVDLRKIEWKPSFVFRGVRSLPLTW